MTPDQLDKLLAYIDARIEERAVLKAQHAVPYDEQTLEFWSNFHRCALERAIKEGDKS